MDVKSFILKLLVLPKSATFVLFVVLFATCPSELSALTFQSPPGMLATFQSPPGMVATFQSPPGM